jgi:hypothetical protein
MEWPVCVVTPLVAEYIPRETVAEQAEVLMRKTHFRSHTHMQPTPHHCSDAAAAIIRALGVLYLSLMSVLYKYVWIFSLAHFNFFVILRPSFS